MSISAGSILCSSEVKARQDRAFLPVESISSSMPCLFPSFAFVFPFLFAMNSGGAFLAVFRTIAHRIKRLSAYGARLCIRAQLICRGRYGFHFRLQCSIHRKHALPEPSALQGLACDLLAWSFLHQAFAFMVVTAFAFDEPSRSSALLWLHFDARFHVLIYFLSCIFEQLSKPSIIL